MTSRDEIARENHAKIHDARFRNVYRDPMPYGQQLALGCLSIVAAFVVALVIAHAFLPVVK